MSAPTKKLFESLEKLCHGKAEENKSEIQQLKKWLTESRESRPSGYMNDPRSLSAYLSYYLPLHLPEAFWVLEQCKEQKIFDMRAGNFAPKSLLDLGAGPGTATLSTVLWMQTRNLASPDRITLVDLSRNVLDRAALLLEPLLEGRGTQIEKLRSGLQTFDARRLKDKYDFVIMSHVLNEFGSGPRFRTKKVQLLEKVLAGLEDKGHMLIIEPPLREPTLDLMWLRDEIAKTPGLRILAPCPRGVALCPMRKESLGWCYAQPPREWAHGFELAPWDRGLERSTATRLNKMSFSYLLLQRDLAAAPNIGGSAKHGIAITDEKARDGLLCTSRGVQIGEVPHRGAFVKP